MDDLEKKYQGKTFSFFELINTHNIEIPIIQRDYAQGRDDKKEIRDNFLNALYLSLKGNNQLKLDFIYGSIVNDAFQPLDGQQRLTTLFLLHWYAATKDNYLNTSIQKLLSKFSYETRISSRDFCKSIINNRITINKNSIISNIIIDSPWFYLSWKKDPTIKAMLRTIDDIHEKFYLIDNLWEQLISETLPICFYYVELENIGLTDDLYIKMNARGKLLSTFEKFKAGFQKYINNNKWEEDYKPTETFAFKIDTKWSELFWTNFCNNKQSIDDSLVRFIATIAMIRHAIEKKEERIGYIIRLNDNPSSIRPELFSKESFSYLKNCFDLYCNVLESDIDLNLSFPLWRHKPTKDFLSQIVSENENVSYTQKVLFYAQTEFLMHNIDNFNKNKFEEWMRVIRNIVSRGNIEVTGKRPDIIRSPQTFDGVINLISELSEGCSDIYEYLSKVEKINSSFARNQVEEEKLKAKLLTYINNQEIKEIIYKIEDNDLLMGRIEFALSCIEFDYSNANNIDVEKFNKVGQIINKYFSKETDISNDIRRALLTIEVNGNYDYYDYWWSFWYVGNANKRCLIDKFRELEYYIYSDCKLYFKKLILKLIDSSLTDVIENFTPPYNMPNWKIRLIKEPELLNDNNSHYIAIPEDNSCCYLLKSKHPRDIDGGIKIV